ncbi:MAG: endolytic transglycosylase MltG [Actinobacteria bacterium]|nr:MAG: endolytic transglycosylase MltG [Actinomycetota bacterium]
MVERRPGVIPPRQGPPPRRPSGNQVMRRRVAALAVLVLALGGLGWLAVAAIGGGNGNGTNAVAPLVSRTSSTLVYTTVTRSVNGKETTTVIAMPKPFHVVFPEGFTVRQMAERVGAVRAIAAKERHVKPRLSTRTYVAATRRATPPPCFRGRATSMEGFLFPATYEFFKTTTSAQLVKNQFSAFCDNWQRVDLAYARQKNLTPYDVLIIASMVEKETLSPDERPLVAAVIYNRLHQHIPLGIDATLRYGLNIPPTQSILESQLQSNSPYNTRKLLGLPPTPIANPGLASMQAAAHPANADYLYFVRKPDKKHHFFTASFQAFQQYEAAHGYGQH